jgi:oligopeptide/dipeptide ABC transporter ATP-binding protein
MHAPLDSHIDIAAAASPVLRVEGLWVEFPRYGLAPLEVLRGIDVAIAPQEVVGLVGESGSGKTTLSRAIMGVVPPPGRVVRGRVVFRDRDLAELSEDERRRLRGRAISMVIANPRSELNPLLPVGVQIENVIRHHLGTSAREARAAAVELLREVRIPDPERRYRAYPHELSGGMAQRVVMAIALACSPAFIISDDATSGLDVTVQAQVLELMRRLVDRHRTAMLFITRDIGIAAHFCDRVAVIHAGEIVEIAERREFFANPAHPYTVLLLAAFSHNPKLRARWLRAAEAGGTAALPAAGCRFAHRCVFAQQRCRGEAPVLRELRSGHAVRCHFPVER